MPLRGQVLCPDVFSLDGQATYPKTFALLKQCHIALASKTAVPSYQSTLIDILSRRYRLQTVDSPELPPDILAEEVRNRLSESRSVSLVHGLQDEGGLRLWGCVAKAPEDISRFGSGICINADITLALESTETDYTEAVCRLLLCATFADETMHLLNHTFFPTYLLENTPPGFFDLPGESGWELEQKLFGGRVGVTWKSDTSVGSLEDVVLVWLRGGSSGQQNDYLMITGENINTFLFGLSRGKILVISNIATKTMELPPYPMVNTRAQRSDTSLRPGLGLPWKPGYVMSLVGADKVRAQLAYCVPDSLKDEHKTAKEDDEDDPEVERVDPDENEPQLKKA
ncbi:hypothetical protein B0H17DRAFT_1206754 [Mycena rosella]|uniref:Uncharacterized protein n=1 Tax=Mycena rosella TaxID=1033263 RepID=A0AAD7GD58_MYCRO|nr:hypothetical protein B0H17DRAFT_1206754 [Mycena rosella]